MDAHSIIVQVSDELDLNWNDESIIEVLCEYIDNQGDCEALEDFARRRGEREKHMEEC